MTSHVSRPVSEKIRIAAIEIHIGEPVMGNPYCGFSLVGNVRRQALIDFRDGKPNPKYTYWHTPACGRASRLTDPALVDWSGLPGRSDGNTVLDSASVRG